MERSCAVYNDYSHVSASATCRVLTADHSGHPRCWPTTFHTITAGDGRRMVLEVAGVIQSGVM